MTTYFTKCGREFEKSGNAVVTGYHIEGDEFSAYDGKCVECPFIVSVKDGWPEQKHKRWECRAGSQPPNHTTEWRGNLNDKNTLNIYSLDVKFMTEVIAYAQNHTDLSAAYNADSQADCRRTISVSCSGNKKGMAAKKELIDKFFPADAELDTEEGTPGEEICDNCGNYRSTTTDIGTCSLKKIAVSRIRPACDDYGPGEVDTGEEGLFFCTQDDCPFNDRECSCNFDLDEHRDEQWYDDVEMAANRYRCQNDALMAVFEKIVEESGVEVTEQNEQPDLVNETPENVTEESESVNDSIPDVIKPVEVEQAPAFDYGILTQEAAGKLRRHADNITSHRIKAVYEIGRELAEAHDELKANQVFGAWCKSIGISRDTAENYMRAYQFVAENFGSLEQGKDIQPSLLFAVSKPSAPPELAQAVIDGDITKHKDYIAALKEMNEAKEWGKKQADYAEEHMKRARDAEFELGKKDTAIKALRSDLEFTKGRMKHLEAAVPDARELEEKRNQIENLENEIAELREQLNLKPVVITAEVKDPPKSTELLPCPFCGGKAEYEQFANPKTSYSVRCTVCRCGTYGWDCPSTGTHDENKVMQAERWNRREGGSDR